METHLDQFKQRYIIKHVLHNSRNIDHSFGLLDIVLFLLIYINTANKTVFVTTSANTLPDIIYLLLINKKIKQLLMSSRNMTQ